ncbi:MAG TPA: O-antigen polymerase [Mycobacteriales bacterium]|nr:O-antigen polymerase [Mycobacteriales bacterium]
MHPGPAGARAQRHGEALRQLQLSMGAIWLVVGGIAAGMTLAVGTTASPRTYAHAGIAVAALCGAAVAQTRRWLQPMGIPFIASPLGLPFMILLLQHLLPAPAFAYFDLDGVPAFNPDGSGFLFRTSTVLVITYCLAASLVLARPVREAAEPPPSASGAEAAPIGIVTVLMLVVLGMTSVILLVATQGTSYGANQLTRGVGYYASLILVVAVAPIWLVYLYLRERGAVPFLLTRLFGAFVVLSAAVTALTGVRNVVVALLLAWFYRAAGGRSVRRPSRAKLLVGVPIVIGFLVAVGVVRNETTQPATGREAAEVALGSLSSAGYLTTQVLPRADTDPPLLGSSYAQSVSGFIPGGERGLGLPLQFQLAYERRSAPNPNSGYGYSALTESYQNFRYVGVALLGAFAGGGLAVLYRRKGRFIAYPLFAAYLPYAMRTDSLGVMKQYMYSALAVGVMLLLEPRSMRPKSDRRSAAVPVRASALPRATV